MIKTMVKFEAAHRQFGDTGKCGNNHGHNWEVEIEIQGTVGELGYIVDFKELKALVEPMDHATILHESDPFCVAIRESNQRLYTLPVNPTCENIADHIAVLIMTKHVNVCICNVTVWENTESCADTTAQAFMEGEVRHICIA